MEEILITLLEYEQLVRNSRKLSALENAGVDNWEGYDQAMEMLEMEENS